MSFVRPEVLATVRRYREALSGSLFAGLGLWLMLDGIGARFWFGSLVAMFGIGLVVAGIPRARARLGGGGAGVVDIDERRITYFGPVSGGAMALGDIERIAVDPGRRWVLTSDKGDQMTVPMTAEGADQLFDAFTALPGMSQATLVRVIEREVSARRVIWQKPQARLG